MWYRPRIRDAVPMAIGALLFLIPLLVLLYFQKPGNPAEQLALKNRRLELVARMQRGLASASETEKSAVLAITDEDSQKFADQARAATAEVERERGELSELLAGTGNQRERDLLLAFSQAFVEFQRIDKNLLELAVKNTNLKASSLAFGPATAAIKEMDAALAQITTEDPRVIHLADSARIAAWRLLTLIPPHIAEESDQRMDEMETQMTKEDRIVRQALDELTSLPTFAGNADLKAAAASYTRFAETKVQVLKLSRENTNVLSLSISLNQKRKIMLVCQDALEALQQAIEAESVPGMTRGEPPNPRRL